MQRALAQRRPVCVLRRRAHRRATPRRISQRRRRRHNARLVGDQQRSQSWPPADVVAGFGGGTGLIFADNFSLHSSSTYLQNVEIKFVEFELDI